MQSHDTLSTVILKEKFRKCQQFFSKGFSTDYGRYRFQVTLKKSQEKSSVIFAQSCAPGNGL